MYCGNETARIFARVDLSELVCIRRVCLAMARMANRQAQARVKILTTYHAISTGNWLASLVGRLYDT